MLGETDAAAERLYELMSVYRHMTITAGIVTVCYGAASRYLGMLAVTLGDFDKAEAHFEHALELNERMRARPWLAHAKAEYALLLRRRGGRGDGERAEVLANEAWEIAAELDMVRLKRRLQPTINEHGPHCAGREFSAGDKACRAILSNGLLPKKSD